MDKQTNKWPYMSGDNTKAAIIEKRREKRGENNNREEEVGKERRTRVARW